MPPVAPGNPVAGTLSDLAGRLMVLGAAGASWVRPGARVRGVHFSGPTSLGVFMHLTKKTWIILGVAYGLLWVAYGATGKSAFDHPITPMEAILFSPLAFGFSIYCIQFGHVTSRITKVERSETPVKFWINIALLLGISLAITLWGILNLANSSSS